MRRPAAFTAVVRGGARARREHVVVHHLADLGDDAAQVGLVVGRQVGGSVVRHRVSRRLRAELSRRLHLFPAGSGTVVRALPPAADASSAALGADLDAALRRLLRDGTRP